MRPEPPAERASKHRAKRVDSRFVARRARAGDRLERLERGVERERVALGDERAEAA